MGFIGLSPGLQKAAKVLEHTGADAVMIGRASYGRPWLAGQIGAELSGGPAVATPEGAGLADLVCEHIEAMLEHYGRDKGLKLARKHVAWYLDGVTPAMPASLRKAVLTSQDAAFVLSTLRDWILQGGQEAAA